MIGTLGKKIVFEVSDDTVMTFQNMSREVSGRWANHEALGVKPKPEFLGPGNQTISLPITLSAALGVKPRAVLETVEAMVESGAAEYLVIGTKPVGKNPFRLTGSSETWDKVYSRGELAKATVTITLEEYT
ncbi:MAG: phage tail protein [Oscillibacter sp.]